jgi:hypothetical protein
MYAGQFVFTQLTDHLPWHVFRRCVALYDGDRKAKSFSCLDQFRCLAFAQLPRTKVRASSSFSLCLSSSRRLQYGALIPLLPLPRQRHRLLRPACFR